MNKLPNLKQKHGQESDGGEEEESQCGVTRVTWRDGIWQDQAVVCSRGLWELHPELGPKGSRKPLVLEVGNMSAAWCWLPGQQGLRAKAGEEVGLDATLAWEPSFSSSFFFPSFSSPSLFLKNKTNS